MATRKKHAHRYVTEETAYQLDCLLEYVGAGELREHLLEIYHSYIAREHGFPDDLPRLAQGMKALIGFLKTAEEETQKQR